eukprot:g29760.t1
MSEDQDGRAHRHDVLKKDREAHKKADARASAAMEVSEEERKRRAENWWAKADEGKDSAADKWWKVFQDLKDAPIIPEAWHEEEEEQTEGRLETKAVKYSEPVPYLDGDGAFMNFRLWVYYRIVAQRWFDNVVLGLIFINCITIAIADPGRPDTARRNVISVAFEMPLQIGFTIEMVCKLLALGVVSGDPKRHPHMTGYFRDNWNNLDFFIVVTGWLTLLPGVSSFTAVRVLRVLRPLRSLNSVPRLRVLVQALFSATLALRNVMVLLTFLFVIYSVLGVQLYNEALHQRCYLVATNGTLLFGPLDSFCSQFPVLGAQCDTDAGFQCLTIGPPLESGLVSFDNVGVAMLLVFRMVTMEDFIWVMYAIMDTDGGFMCIYFISLTILTSFFAMNLILAVVFDSFAVFNEKAREDEEKQKLEQSEKEARGMSRIDEQSDESSQQGKDAVEQSYADEDPSLPVSKDSIMSRNPKYATNVIDRIAHKQVHGTGLRTSLERHNGVERRPSIPNGPRASGEMSPIRHDTFVFPLGTEGNDENLPDTTRPQSEEPEERGLELIVLKPNLGLAPTPRKSGTLALTPKSKFASGTLALAPTPTSQARVSQSMDSPRQQQESGLDSEQALTRKESDSVDESPSKRQVRVHSTPTAPSLQVSVMGLVVPGLVTQPVSTGSWTAPPRLSEHPAPKEANNSPSTTKAKEEDKGKKGGKEDMDIDRENVQQMVSNAIVEQVASMNHRASRLGGSCPLVLRCFQLVENTWFQAFILFVIVLNTVVLGLEHYEMSQQLIDFMEISNLVFTSIFFVEMILKMIAYGLRGYFEESLNRFDFVIVIMSVVEIPLAYSGVSMGGGFSALRSLRVLRVFKLSRSSKRMTILLGAAAESFIGVGHISLFLLLFCFMCATLGQQLFAARLAVDPLEDTYVSFSGIYWAMLSVFQLLTGDDWPNVMHQLYKNVGFVAIPYCLMVVSLGLYICLNLFVTVVLDGFDAQNSNRLDFLTASDDARNKLLSHYEKGYHILEQKAGCFCARFPEKVKHEYDEHIKDLNQDALWVEIVQDMLEGMADRKKRNQARLQRRFNQVKEECNGTVLGCISETNPLRFRIFHLVTSDWFRSLIVLLIIVNCAFLAIERPGMPAKAADVIEKTDIFFTAVFAFEMCMKIIAFGLYGTPTAYLTSFWNKLDCVIVISSILSVSFPRVKLFRNIRAVRILRVIIRKKEVRVVVSALGATVPEIANVTIFISLFWFVFGIVGVNLFCGKMSVCEDEQLNTKTECLEAGSAWITPYQNFNSVFTAFLTLFQIATLSGWSDIMYAAIDSTEVDQGPEYRNSPLAGIYFIVFIVICSFFSLNLVVGTVLDSFAQLKTEYEGSALMTEEQLKMQRTSQLLAQCKPKADPKPPKRWIQKPFYRLVMHDLFDKTIMLLIVLNSCFMMMQHYNQSPTWDYILYVANLFFVVSFTIEAICKILGLGWKQYQKPAWNKLDFFLVAVSYIGIFVDAGVGVSIFRMLRVARLIRLIPKAKTLSKLLNTLVVSSSSLVNIGSFILVIFFFFAVLGTGLYGTICYSEGGFDEHANFQNFGTSFLALYRISVGDGWEELMIGASITGEECAVAQSEAAPETCDCGSKWAPLYFVIFVIVGPLVMINLFIAVILENYPGEDPTLANGINAWSTQWRYFDPAKTSVLPARLFVEVMSRAPPPFGLKGRKLRPINILKILKIYNIPIFYHPVPATVYQREAEIFKTAPRTALIDRTRSKSILRRLANRSVAPSKQRADSASPTLSEPSSPTPASPTTSKNAFGDGKTRTRSRLTLYKRKETLADYLAVEARCQTCDSLWGKCTVLKEQELQAHDELKRQIKTNKPLMRGTIHHHAERRTSPRSMDHAGLGGAVHPFHMKYNRIKEKRLMAEDKYITHRTHQHYEQAVTYEYCVHFKRAVFALAAYFSGHDADSFSMDDGSNETAVPSPRSPASPTSARSPNGESSPSFSNPSSDPDGKAPRKESTVQTKRKRRNSLVEYPVLSMHEWYAGHIVSKFLRVKVNERRQRINGHSNGGGLNWQSSNSDRKDSHKRDDSLILDVGRPWSRELASQTIISPPSQIFSSISPPSQIFSSQPFDGDKNNSTQRGLILDVGRPSSRDGGRASSASPTELASQTIISPPSQIFSISPPPQIFSSINSPSQIFSSQPFDRDKNNSIQRERANRSSLIEVEEGSSPIEEGSSPIEDIYESPDIKESPVHNRGSLIDTDTHRDDENLDYST